MEFINYTTHWIKGELFEASFITVFGIATLFAGLLFWTVGATPNAKALLLPLSMTGVIYAGIGGGMLVSNNKRMVELPQSYQQDKGAFIIAEKKRVEDFQYGYTISKVVATVFFAVTLLLFWFMRSPVWQGAGIGLTYFALAGLVIDYFSKERADIYYKLILQTLGQS